MANKEILISEATLEKIIDYFNFLKQDGLDTAGKNLKNQIILVDRQLSEMSIEDFTQLLIQSKVPQIFAESDVYHNKMDWNLDEESILGDITVHMPVTFYNDGGHRSYKSYVKPISGNLVYVPGALLRSDIKNTTTSDLQETIVSGKLNQQRFNDLYERRLLPQLFQINEQAGIEEKKAAITVPGIGTGQFAGNYQNQIKDAFRQALESVLEKHHAKLSNIDIVHYDPFEGDNNKTQSIGHIDYRVCPSSKNSTTGQLAFPSGSTAASHTLTSLVAWDHFSWPGNDFWMGSRATDDGVKAASTNTMAVITGIDGHYDCHTGSYLPFKYRTWRALASENKLSFTAPVFVVSPTGKKTALSEVSQQANNDDVQAPITVTKLPTGEKINILDTEAHNDSIQSIFEHQSSKTIVDDEHEENNILLDMYMRYPSACIAILAGLAVAAVALIAVSGLGLTLPAVVGVVAGSALLASSLMFFASNEITKPEARVSENIVNFGHIWPPTS